MKRLILFLALLVSGVSANAAHFYVREAATGTRSGADWNNAYTNFNNISWGSMSAGDSIWIAGGTYQTLSVGASGATNSPIYIARVRSTNATPAAAAGWNSSFDSLVTIGGTAPVTVTGRDFITIDGQIPYGGLLITNTAATSDSASRYSVSIGSGSDYFTLRGVKVRLCNRAYNVGSSTYDRRCVNISYSTANIASGLTIQDSDFAEGDTLFSILFQKDVLIERNLFHDNNREAVIGPHQNVWQTVGCTNVIFRYNMITNYQEECIMMCFVSTSDAPNDTWYIYGNLFADGTENSRVLESQYVTNRNIFFYNNTIANTGFLGIRGSGTANGGVWENCYSTNNILFNSGAGSGVGFGLGTDDYNITDGTTAGANSISSATSAMFVDENNRDYRISSTVSSTLPKNKGRSLSVAGQTLDVDAAGNTRGSDGTWDLGWLEEGAGGGGGDSPPPAKITIGGRGVTFGGRVEIR